MKRHLLILAATAGCWALTIVLVFVYVDRKLAQAAGWLA